MAQGTPKLKKRKTGSIIIGSVIVLIILGLASWWYIHKRGFITTDDAYIEAYKVTISSQIPGRIIRLTTHEGEEVKEGKLLAQLDTTDYVARIVQAAAGLKEAKLGIELAKVRLEQSKINYDRAKKQYNEQIIPKANFENIQKEYQAAKVQLSLTESKIPAIEASINTIQNTLKHTQIVAPMDGVVAKRWALAGDVVAPGQGIFTVFSTKKHWVTAMLPENKIHNIRLGDTVEIDVDAFPNTSFKGKIYKMGNSTASQFSLIPPDNASGNFTKVSQRIPIKMTIEQVGNKGDAKKKLLPGMSVEIRIKIRKNESGK